MNDRIEFRCTFLGESHWRKLHFVHLACAAVALLALDHSEDLTGLTVYDCCASPHCSLLKPPPKMHCGEDAVLLLVKYLPGYGHALGVDW